jgi:hypothetical protein
VASTTLSKMTSAAQVRAALDALFDTPSESVLQLPPAATAPAIVPTSLDAVILADTQLTFPVDAYRWFAGRDLTGVLRIFRFKRGLDLPNWHETLLKQHLTSISGPFRTAHVAQRANL